MKRNKLYFSLAAVLWLFLCMPAKAAPPLKESPLPPSLTAGFNHLLKVANPAAGEAFDLTRIEPVLDFIAQPAPANELGYSTDVLDMPSAYFQFDVAASLARIIQYTYNSQIPAVVTRPSSVRLSHWTEVDHRPQPLPRLWEYLPDLSSPRIVHGVEHVENTPDLFSGAYFAYDLDRTLILCRYKEKNLLISLSRQKQVSDVGRKGWILGSDEDWNYLYTGEKGINKTGLGWVDAYMYDSFTVAIYMQDETTPGAPITRCGTIQWLKAGWAGMNLVKRSHIYRGIHRFAHAFKQVIENPNLPDASEMAALFSHYEHMPEAVLREKTRQHLRLLSQRYDHEKRQVADLLTRDHYWQILTPEEMSANLIKEYTKVLIGKENSRQAPYLIGARQPSTASLKVRSQ
jgi:hypothetical protein